MNGSPAKLGTIQGTTGHTSALKMKKKSEETTAEQKAGRKTRTKTSTKPEGWDKYKRETNIKKGPTEVSGPQGPGSDNKPMEMEEKSPTPMWATIAKVAAKGISNKFKKEDEKAAAKQQGFQNWKSA